MNSTNTVRSIVYMSLLAVLMLGLVSCAPEKEKKAEQSVHAAASSGDTTTVEKYLDNGGDPNAKDAKEVPLLVNSLGPKGSEKVAKELLEKGADPNSKDSFSRTALMEAVQRGRVDMVKLLLEKGADPNAVDEQGYNALMCVKAKNEDDVLSIVKLLIDKGTDVNKHSFDGNTPLKHAMDLKMGRVIQALRAAGAK